MNIENRKIYKDIIEIKKKLKYKDRILFDKKTHTYYINGELYETSVTKYIHNFFPKFDAKKVIEKYYDYWQNNPNHKYYKLKKEDILSYWNSLKQDASHNGTILHAKIEEFYETGEHKKEKPNFKITSEEDQQFINFHNENRHLQPIKTEFIIYNEEIKLAGSIDIIFYNEKEKTIHIYDWKRCSEIKENAYEYGYFPLTHIPNSNFWHYSLQLNFYKKMIEDKFKIRIESLNLVIFNKKRKNYQILKLPDLQKEIELLFLQRKKELEIIDEKTTNQQLTEKIFDN